MATSVQVAGMTAITVGALLFSVPAGLIVGGVFLLVVGNGGFGGVGAVRIIWPGCARSFPSTNTGDV